MGGLLNVMTASHRATGRDYLKRMMDDKTACMRLAREYGADFWDGDRRYGYGGYHYDGRWKGIAEKLIAHYNLPPNANVLDIGCGKGFLLYEIKKLRPDLAVFGYDISPYAIAHAQEDIRPFLTLGRAQEPFPYADGVMDLILSLMTLHNLLLPELAIAVKEIERVGRNKYITLESYRNEAELFNLQCWSLTCECFLRPEEWVWLLHEFGYGGDYEFLYFE